MRPPAGRMLRFTGGERALHWAYTALFTILLLTGLGLYLPPGQNPVLDRRELVRSVHLDAALALILLPVILPTALTRLWHDTETFDADDGRWLRRILVPPRLRRALPPQGRFNAGQKVNTIVVAAATVGFIVTGAMMYGGAHLPTSLSEAADSWHIWLSVAMLPLIAGHLTLALLVPSTRPALRGIITGWVSTDFARRRHRRWVDGPDAQTAEPPMDGDRTARDPAG